MGGDRQGRWSAAPLQPFLECPRSNGAGELSKCEQSRHHARRQSARPRSASASGQRGSRDVTATQTSGRDSQIQAARAVRFKRADVRPQIQRPARARLTRDRVSLAAGTFPLRLQAPPICGSRAAICRVGCGEGARAERRRRREHPLRAQRAPALLDTKKKADRPLQPYQRASADHRVRQTPRRTMAKRGWRDLGNADPSRTSIPRAISLLRNRVRPEVSVSARRLCEHGNAHRRAADPMSSATNRANRRAADPMSTATDRANRRAADPMSTATNRANRRAADPMSSATNRANRRAADPMSSATNRE